MPQTGEYSDDNSLQLSTESQGFNSLPPSPPQLRIVEEKLDLEDIKQGNYFNIQEINRFLFECFISVLRIQIKRAIVQTKTEKQTQTGEKKRNFKTFLYL